MIEPKVEDLLERVDNQYTLVVLAAKRARQIVDYYARLGAGSQEKPLPPMLPLHGLKPLSIALREVAEGMVGFERPPGAEEAVK